MYSTTTIQRFEEPNGVPLAMHMLIYPWEWLGCMLPWSFLLIGYANRAFRQTLGPARQNVLFLLCCVVVALPTCWLIPNAKTRYLMPIYPCVACLVALVAERCWQAGRSVPWRRIWSLYVTLMAVVMAATGVVIVVASSLDGGSLPIAQPAWFALAYLAITVALAVLAMKSRHAVTARQQRAAVLSIAVFFALSYTGVSVNSRMRRSEYSTEPAITQLKHRLPADTKLASYERVDILFAYYYQDLIAPIRSRQQWHAWEKESEYFCFNIEYAEEIPFPYEKIAAIVCDRNQRPEPQRVVIVGRRAPESHRTAKLDPPKGGARIR